MIDITAIDFSKVDGLVPCIVQDEQTRKVLMLGFMNKEALLKTMAEKKVTFFSRTKNRLWTKGETSGNFLELVGIKTDCDNDTLLVTAKPHGPTCHTGADTCFNEKNDLFDLTVLEQIIIDRRRNPKSGSYTNTLFDSGLNKIAQKVGEEAVELVIEAKDDNRELFMNEAADLMFHFLVLLQAKGISLGEVTAVLAQRHKK
jgi:phosphoribosyl-AMP cyclohydrolase / phosphoribosyl-ATP pyrophosphohydrolase